MAESIESMNLMLPSVYLLIFLVFGFLIFRRPLWGLFIAVVTELWLANFFLFGSYYMRLRLIILPYILFILFLWLTFGGTKPKLNRVVQYFLLIQASVVMVVIIVNFAHATPLEVAAVQIARAGVSVVITLIVYLLIDTSQKLKTYIIVIGIALLISSLVGILQIQFGETFYQFKSLLVHKPDLLAIDTRGEASGLALYSLPLAYQLVCFSPILISLLLYSNFKKVDRAFVMVGAVVMGLALFFTTVRSAVIGILVWFLGIMVYRHRDTKAVLSRKVALLSLSIFLIVIVYLYFPLSIFFTFGDRSAQARLPLNIVGIRIALEHPLGIGSAAEFTEFSAENYAVVAHMEGAKAIGYLSPHNQFLNTLLYWGIPGFVLLIFLFVYKFKILFSLLKSKDVFLWSVTFGILGVSVAYTINSFFHNAGPFVGDVFYWYIIGLIPALARISANQLVEAEKEEALNEAES